MRRAAMVLGVVVVAGAAVFGLVAIFNGRDDSTTGAVSGGPGVAATAPRGLQAPLRAGNIVIEYPTVGASARPLFDVAPLHRLVRDVAGADPAPVALRRAGQAIELRGVGGRDAIVAYAYRRILRTRDPADPALREFAEYWLGRGTQD